MGSEFSLALARLVLSGLEGVSSSSSAFTFALVSCFALGFFGFSVLAALDEKDNLVCCVGAGFASPDLPKNFLHQARNPN